MTALILGLLVFLGVHSVRIFAEDWRNRQIANMGLALWKSWYSLAAVLGFVLLVWGYGHARQATLQVWTPPHWTATIAAVLTVPAFILVVAAYIPRTRIKAAVGHPMVLGVKVWALAHLFANGTLADIVLFGAFLLWAVADYSAARRRDRANAVRYTAGPASRDVIAVVIGLAAWAAFAFWLHGPLIGAQPFA